MAYASLVIALSALLLLLSWIGWRFFVAPTRQVDAPASPARMETAATQAARWNPRHLPSIAFWSTVACLLAGSLVGSVFSLSAWIAPDPLAAPEMNRQPHIQAALNPEKLVPPPPLPPSLFAGSERPALESADRDWGKLNPRFTQPVLHLLARLQDRGYSFVLLEGYRSPERQDKLADLGSQVTNARAFQSQHQFGLAVDLAPLRDGRLLISERNPWAMQAYLALGEEAEKAGLSWGGRWSFKDYGHIEAATATAAIARSGRSDDRKQP